MFPYLLVTDGDAVETITFVQMFEAERENANLHLTSAYNDNFKLKIVTFLGKL